MPWKEQALTLRVPRTIAVLLSIVKRETGSGYTEQVRTALEAVYLSWVTDGLKEACGSVREQLALTKPSK